MLHPDSSIIPELLTYISHHIPGTKAYAYLQKHRSTSSKTTFPKTWTMTKIPTLKTKIGSGRAFVLLSGILWLRAVLGILPVSKMSVTSYGNPLSLRSTMVISALAISVDCLSPNASYSRTSLSCPTPSSRSQILRPQQRSPNPTTYHITPSTFSSQRTWQLPILHAWIRSTS
jgi:hypothetical protein